MSIFQSFGMDTVVSAFAKNCSIIDIAPIVQGCRKPLNPLNPPQAFPRQPSKQASRGKVAEWRFCNFVRFALDAIHWWKLRRNLFKQMHNKFIRKQLLSWFVKVWWEVSRAVLTFKFEEQPAELSKTKQVEPCRNQFEPVCAWKSLDGDFSFFVGFLVFLDVVWPMS